MDGSPAAAAYAEFRRRGATIEHTKRIDVERVVEDGKRLARTAGVAVDPDTGVPIIPGRS